MTLLPPLPGLRSDPPQTPRPQRHHRPETFIKPRHTAKIDIRAHGITECSRQDKLGKGGTDVVSGNHSMESSGFDSHPGEVNHRPEASLACECGDALLEA